MKHTKPDVLEALEWALEYVVYKGDSEAIDLEKAIKAAIAKAKAKK